VAEPRAQDQVAGRVGAQLLGKSRMQRVFGLINKILDADQRAITGEAARAGAGRAALHRGNRAKQRSWR
jgi:hypothetical protein